jgi:hypothetical protein
MTSYSDENGTTTISAPARTARRSSAELVASGFVLRGNDWRRDVVNTETHGVTEVYRSAMLQTIEWVAA